MKIIVINLKKRNLLTGKFEKKSRNENNNTKRNVFVIIGRVIKAHGILGEVKVQQISNIAGRFKSLSEVILELINGEFVQYEIEYSKICGETVFLKLNGINNRDDAEKLRGANVNVTLDNIAPLDDDSYYIFDLEGLDVFDLDNKKIGFVKRVEEYPANDVIVIEKETEEIMIPAIKEFVIEVDLKANKIIVNLSKDLPKYPK